MYQEDFVLPPSTYLLSHSVGRPLKSAREKFEQAFFEPWQRAEGEPWGEWLGVVDGFCQALGRLFNAPASEFCPQTNLSSGLTKLVMSLERLQRRPAVVLMSEIDFPSMGFVLQQALPAGSEIRFIDKALDVTDANVWDDHLTPDIDLVFVSHAYSNTGQQPPVDAILTLARERRILSVLDIAQSAGVIPLDLQQRRPDFMLGSCVKWLCGGPGAAYLWIHPERIDDCRPRDVGWFSHDNPFEFDIHHFKPHHGALRFWGGTPSVMPYALAAHSIGYFAEIGSPKIRAHNLALTDEIIAACGDALVSPEDPNKRSGTVILHFGNQQQAIAARIKQAGISIDERAPGLRISPHIYNTTEDVRRLLDAIGEPL